MENIIVLVVCLCSGMILRWAFGLKEGAVRAMNLLIVYFFVPVIGLYMIPKIEFNGSLIWLSITPFLAFGFSVIFYRFFGTPLKIDLESRQSLTLTSGISSISFVGFPIFELLYGDLGLAYGVFMSLSGTILVFNTVGVTTLFYFEGHHVGMKGLLKRVLLFPSFHAFLIAILFNLLEVKYPQVLDLALSKITGAFSVVALLAVGLQIDLKMTLEQRRNLVIGQVFKLIIAPLVMYLVVWQLLGMKDLVGRICILGAAIGPMNSMAVLAASRGINPKLSILMSAVGIPLSIPLVFLLDYFLK